MKLKDKVSVADLQLREIREQLEAETYFSSLYKTLEKEYIRVQLQLALAKRNSEQLARQIAEKQLSDVESEFKRKEKEFRGLQEELTKKCERYY